MKANFIFDRYTVDSDRYGVSVQSIPKVGDYVLTEGKQFKVVRIVHLIDENEINIELE